MRSTFAPQAGSGDRNLLAGLSLSRMCVIIAFLLSPSILACQEAGESKPLARVSGSVITSEDLEKALGIQLAKLQEQIYELKRQKLEALIDERLLAEEASKRGITVDALLEQEVNTRAGEVVDADVESFYQANRARIREDSPALREQIRSYLENQKHQMARTTYLASLRERANVEIFLEAPIYRAEISVDGAPSFGPSNAPVTIVEVSDYHCPYCRTVQPTLKQVLSKYGDSVRLVFKDFPLDALHPDARKAAEAARCANDQGKYWPYHDKLYAGGADASIEKLKEYARELELEVTSFETCVQSGKYADAVQKDVDEATGLGVTGTPTFFINGRMLTGAQPLERFSQLIDEELARPAVR